ncbi:MAG: hypothetical protein R2911_03605 [Caldilineaceae bacterium]
MLIPLAYEGKLFKLTVNQAGGDCTGVNVTASEVRQQDGRSVLPLRLSSQGICAAQDLHRQSHLAGPNGDYDVFPAEVSWQVRVDEVEWSIANSELSLGDLRLPGERVQTTLLVRFNGKTPFVIEASDLAATATLPDGQVQLTPTELEFPPVEVTGEPNENGLYAVPVTLAARQQIPNDPLRGAYYSGGINLNIRGLPNAEQMLKFNLRSPTLIQRYVAPIVVPVYTMPWALCTWPLTLFLLIMMLARMRGRDFEEEEWEEAAVASLSQPQGQGTSAFGHLGQAASESEAAQAARRMSASQADAVWGSSAWGQSDAGSSTSADAGSAWDNNGGWSGSGSAASNGSTAAKGDDDPWRSSW